MAAGTGLFLQASSLALKSSNSLLMSTRGTSTYSLALEGGVRTDGRSWNVGLAGGAGGADGIGVGGSYTDLSLRQSS